MAPSRHEAVAEHPSNWHLLLASQLLVSQGNNVLQLLCAQVVAGRRFVGIMGLELVGNYAVRCVLYCHSGTYCAVRAVMLGCD
jgi:hypothetical protein